MAQILKSQAIVLHYTKYGDTGAVIHVVDSVSGRRSFFLRGIGKSRGSSALAPFHSLNVLNVVTVATPHSSMPCLKEYSPIFNLGNIRGNIYKNAVAIFISEVIYRSLREDDGDAALFGSLAGMIVALDSAKGSAANFHLWFLVLYSIKAGFRPRDNFDAREAPLFCICTAQFTTRNPAIPEEAMFTAEDSSLLHTLLNSTVEEALAIPLSASRRQHFSTGMLKYLSYHFGVQLEIRSLKVLHDIFA